MANQNNSNEDGASSEAVAAQAQDGLLSAPEESGQQSPTTAEQQEASKPTVEPRPPALNVVQEFPIFTPLEKPWSEDDLILPLAADTYARTQEVLTAQPNLDPTKTEQGREWAFYAHEGRASQQSHDYFQRTVTREGSQFHQAVKSEKGLLGATAPVLKENTEGVKLVGEAAVLRVRALQGLGTVVTIPLWHSGIWVTLKAPTDGALLELHRRLTEEKIALGRQTYGLAYANNSVFFAGAVADFALNHVYDSSLKDKSPANVRKLISSLDLPLLAWGLACTMWPKGFQYARAVLDQNQNQVKVVKEKINVAKLLFVDTKELTPWQITHMAQRFGNVMTNEAVEKYRNEFTIGRGREVELAPNLHVTLKVPTLDEYLNNGQRWINNIVAMVDRAFGMSQDDESRNEYILQQGKASNFRQYGHWVESLNAGGGVIDEPETLDETFDALSSDDSIRDRFFQGVRSYMEDSTMAIIAVPTFEKEEQDKTLPRHPHLMALDVLSTFFTLLVQRTQKVVSRL